jgi:hypothetical protein
MHYLVSVSYTFWHLQVEEPSVFSDLNQLKHRPAHLAVFLHYLLSNSDPSSLASSSFDLYFEYLFFHFANVWN